MANKDVVGLAHDRFMIYVKVGDFEGLRSYVDSIGPVAALHPELREMVSFLKASGYLD